MNFISLCSHKAVVSMKSKDAEMLLDGLNLLANDPNDLRDINNREKQRDLRRILDLERKLKTVHRWTKKQRSGENK